MKRSLTTRTSPAHVAQPPLHRAPRNGIAHPLLTYLGGKWLLAPWVLDHLPPHQCYVELFGGAASVLLSKPPARHDVLNDLDDDVHNLYSVMRSPVRSLKLLRALRRTPYSRTEYLSAFKPAREPVERARRLVVRGAMAFHPRAVHGERTTFHACAHRPGAPTFRNYQRSLVQIARRLRPVTLEHRPALQLIDRYDSPQTLFYADPPYIPETRSSAATYAHEMTAPDHEALLTKLRKVQGMVAISGYPSNLYRDTLHDWSLFTREHRVFSTGSAKTAGRNKRVEALWLNPAAAEALGRTSQSD